MYVNKAFTYTLIRSFIHTYTDTFHVLKSVENARVHYLLDAFINISNSNN